MRNITQQYVFPSSILIIGGVSHFSEDGGLVVVGFSVVVVVVVELNIVTER